MMKNKYIYILGINISNHDRSACLLKNGDIAYAISEERIDRRKYSEGYYQDKGFFRNGLIIPPMGSIYYVLSAENISIDDVDLIVLGRSLTNVGVWASKFINIKNKDKIVEIPLPGHHLAHAYSTYFCSSFNEAAILVVDEQGHWINDEKYEKYSLFTGKNNRIELIKTVYGTRDNISLGIFYDMICAILGVTSYEAGTLMALSATGRKIKDWPDAFTINQDREIDISYSKLINFLKKEFPSACEFHRSAIPRKFLHAEYTEQYSSERSVSGKEQNLAHWAQQQLEKMLIEIVNDLYKRTKLTNLCVAGGVALNSVANSKIIKYTPVKKIFIQPAAKDDGTAIGLAMYGWHHIMAKSKRFYMTNAYLGRSYKKRDFLDVFRKEEYSVLPFRLSKNVVAEAAELLSKGKIIGWFQGRSEFGPRALGNRSILADPRKKEAKDILNYKIKKREYFRPYASSIIEEKLTQYFDLACDSSPFMLFIAKVRNEKKDLIPAVLHIDGTSRIQVVSHKDNEIFYDLIKEFEKITKIPLVLNTSFNGMGEPIVETPEDALLTFLCLELDALVLGDYIVYKSDIPQSVLNGIVKTYENERIYFDKRGRVYEKKGLYKSAIEDYERYLELYPEQWQIYCSLADCYYKIGKFSKAIDNLLKAIQLNPEANEKIYFLLGSCHRKTRQYKEAIKEFRKAEKLNFNNFHINFMIANCYRKLKQLKFFDTELKKGICKLKRFKK